jgi:[protein-PII] uridylyltransferase
VTDLLGDTTGVALMAVGSYGRDEMCPGSDLDLLLLHTRPRDIAAVADQIWYPIWDAHVKLDHSVRTVAEALAVAESDLKAELGLVDARFVAGDEQLAKDFIARAGAQWQRRAPSSLRRIEISLRERHAVAGELGFLLEPELKDGRGGLRDIALLQALGAAFPHLEAGPAVHEASELLLACRVALHRIAGRATDRLVLEWQDQVAEAIGLQDADELMSRLASAARTVSWTLDRSWRDAQRRDVRRTERGTMIGHGLVLFDGDVDLDDTAKPYDATTMLQVAAAAAHREARIGMTTLELLGDHAPVLDGPWPPAAREALVSLLGAGQQTVEVLEALDQYDLISRILPEWAAVRNKPQRNAFHTFTVDRHLMEAAAQATRFTRRVARPDLLLVGAWLHDLGKGYPGDHTDAGVELMSSSPGRMGIAERMGFSPVDQAVLVDLVRLHLLLPSVATSRDLTDPATIAMVAEAVGSIETLELLTVLTEADSLATGPSAWSPWKAELIADLVRRVSDHLRDQHIAVEPELDDDAASLVIRARGGLLIEGDRSHFTLVSPDRQGLFAAVVGLLALHRQDVRSARAWSDGDGMVIDEFVIEPLVRPPNWEQFRDDLDRVLNGRLALEPRLAARAIRYQPKMRPSAAHVAAPMVQVHNDASSRGTVVEVRAADGVGVLYRITKALADLHLDIRHAMVSTIGHEVVDTFYVLDIDGKQIDEPAVADEVRTAVLFALHQSWSPLPS